MQSLSELVGIITRIYHKFPDISYSEQRENGPLIVPHPAF